MEYLRLYLPDLRLSAWDLKQLSKFSARFSRQPASPSHFATASAATDSTKFACWSSLRDRKSTRLNSSHVKISYAVFCLKKKTIETNGRGRPALTRARP